MIMIVVLSNDVYMYKQFKPAYAQMPTRPTCAACVPPSSLNQRYPYLNAKVHATYDPECYVLLF